MQAYLQVVSELNTDLPPSKITSAYARVCVCVYVQVLSELNTDLPPSKITSVIEGRAGDPDFFSELHGETHTHTHTDAHTRTHTHTHRHTSPVSPVHDLTLPTYFKHRERSLALCVPPGGTPWHKRERCLCVCVCVCQCAGMLSAVVAMLENPGHERLWRHVIPFCLWQNKRCAIHTHTNTHTNTHTHTYTLFSTYTCPLYTSRKVQSHIDTDAHAGGVF